MPCCTNFYNIASIVNMESKTYKLHRQAVIAQPLGKVFEFFSKAENLELLTPSWLKFKILTPLPIKMVKGVLIDYQIKLIGLPMNWKTEISEWQPPHFFIDTQLKGPYTKWVHKHHFKEVEKGTEITDIVNYQLPGGLLAPAAHSLIVKHQLKSIFDFRTRIIKEYFDSADA